jgi:hypothetical protein
MGRNCLSFVFLWSAISVRYATGSALLVMSLAITRCGCLTPETARSESRIRRTMTLSSNAGFAGPVRLRGRDVPVGSGWQSVCGAGRAKDVLRRRHTTSVDDRPSATRRILGVSGSAKSSGQDLFCSSVVSQQLIARSGEDRTFRCSARVQPLMIVWVRGVAGE